MGWSGELAEEGIQGGLELHQLVDLHLDAEQRSRQLSILRAHEAEIIATYLLQTLLDLAQLRQGGLHHAHVLCLDIRLFPLQSVAHLFLFGALLVNLLLQVSH